MKTIDFPNDCDQPFVHKGKHKDTNKGKGCVKLGNNLQLCFSTGGKLDHDRDVDLQYPLPKGHFGAGTQFESSNTVSATGHIKFTFTKDGDPDPFTYDLTIDSTKKCDEQPKQCP